ncbi:MAG: hypothetical protein WCO30_00945 [bacterium]
MKDKESIVNQNWIIEEPKKDILGGVYHRMESINRRVFFWRLGVNAVASIFSAIGSYALFGYLTEAMTSSGVMEFLILAWNDSSVITQDFGGFSMAVIEAVPFLEVLAVTVVVLVLVVALLGFIKNARQFSRLGRTLAV